MSVAEHANEDMIPGKQREIKNKAPGREGSTFEFYEKRCSGDTYPLYLALEC